MGKRPSLQTAVAIIAIGITTAYSTGLLVDAPGWINGANWEWVRRMPALTGRWWWLATAVLLFLPLWGWVRRQAAWQRWHTSLLLLWAIAATPLLQLAVAGQHRSQPLDIIFLSATASGFFQDGVRMDAPTIFVREHLANMPTYRDVHVRTQPPGWQLAYWATSRLWQHFPNVADGVGRRLLRADCLAPDLRGIAPAQAAAATLSLSILLWSGLGALPYWGLARFFLEPRPARLALLVYPFWPGLLVFTGRFDVFYAVMALLALWLGQQAVINGRWLAAAVFAVLQAVGTWFGLGTLAIALLVNLVLGAQWLLGTTPRRPALRRLMGMNAGLLAALLALWSMVWLAFDLNGLALFQLSQEIHQKLRINYPVWPLFNLFDLAVFMGIVVFVGALLALLAALRKAARRGAPWQPVDALVLGWVAAVVVLNLSGQVRAETGRLWLFLMGPGLLVGMAGWTGWLDGLAWRRRWETAVLLAFVGQALVTGVLLGGRAPAAAVPEPVWRTDAPLTPLDVTLGDVIRLRGYTVAQENGETVDVTLYWQAADFPRADYAVFAHVIAADGTLLAQDDGPPQQGALPTWCWVPGEVVADRRVLPLVDNAILGVGMYDWRSGLRLPLQPSAADDMVRLPLTK